MNKVQDFLYEQESYNIRGACFEVWKTFKGISKEKVIERALKKELKLKSYKVEAQKKIDIYYKGEKMGSYTPDLVANDKIIIELKVKPYLTKEDEKQFWYYLRGSRYKLGFLINFGSKNLDIRRRVYNKAREKYREIKNKQTTIDQPSTQPQINKLNSASNPRTQSASNQLLKNGFTLIETLIGIFILVLAVLTIYSLFNMSLRVIWESKAKITATQLANQKLEMARNLPYDEVGTIGGIPSGSIPQTENIVQNGINYLVSTNVIYIDDPFDGTQGGEPDDSLPTDYKRVRMQINWQSKYGAKNLVFLTDISPKGIESNEGGGTLKILVFDSLGVPVPQAEVEIINNETSPVVNLIMQTSNDGVVLLPGTPASTGNYQINVTKNDYSTDKTYPATQELPSPDKPLASVYENQVTSISFSIDQLSNLTIYTYDINEIALGYININIHGEKIIGQDSEGLPVYKFDNDYTSNGSGQIILNNTEWDSYTFTLNANEPYNIAEFSPPEPLDLMPNTQREMILKLAPQAGHSVLVIVKDVNNEPLENASVHLSSTAPSLDQTLSTSDAGQAYFTPWAEATTSLEVSLEGYEDYADEIEMGGYFTEEVILITP